MTTCPHPPWALRAMFDGYLKSGESCELCNEILHVDPEPCGCTMTTETDILGTYPVRVRCAQHHRATCERCGAYAYQPVHDATDAAEMRARGLKPRAWCSETCRDADAEQQSAGVA